MDNETVVYSELTITLTLLDHLDVTAVTVATATTETEEEVEIEAAVMTEIVIVNEITLVATIAMVRRTDTDATLESKSSCVPERIPSRF